MIASAIIVELPISIFAGGIYFNCWWWMTELPRGGRAAFGLLLATAFECFYVGLGQALAALSPNPLVASLLVPVSFSGARCMLGTSLTNLHPEGRVHVCCTLLWGGSCIPANASVLVSLHPPYRKHRDSPYFVYRRAWMPYLTPFRWLLSSFLSDVLHDVPVRE